jgi:hypothetical protein
MLSLYRRIRNDSLVRTDSDHVQLWEYGSKVSSPLLGYPQTSLYATYKQVSGWEEGELGSREEVKREGNY